MATVYDPTLGVRMCEQLGLDPKKIRTLTIRFNVGEATAVEFTEILDGEYGVVPEDLGLQEYYLIPKNLVPKSG